MKSGNTIFWSKQSTNTAFAPEISGKHLEMTRKEIRILKKKRHFKIPYKIYQSYERYARLLWIKLPNRKAKETLLIHVEMSWEVWLQ